MPELHNTTDQPITASTGHTVPAGGSLRVTEATLARVMAEPYFAGQVALGNIYAATEPPQITRETIAKARRGDLLEILAEHGITEADVEGEKVAGLRELVTQTLFVYA